MKTYSIGEFAKLTAVTHKTLRHYEKMGLIVPSYNPDNGYRRYQKEDVLKLEMVLALKFMGFELTQIAQFMKRGFSIDRINLHTQKLSLIRKIEKMTKVVDIINNIPQHKNPEYIDLSDLLILIKGMKMEDKNIDWYLKKTENDMRKIAAWLPKNRQEKDTLKKQWQSLLNRAEKLSLNYSEAFFNELADEWLKLLYKCIGDKPDAVKGLLTAYSNMHDWPKERQLFNPKLGAFIGPKLLDYHDSSFLK